MRVLSMLLICFLLIGCATTQTSQPIAANHAEYMAAQGIIPTEVPPPLPMSPDAPPAPAGPTGWQIAGAILLLPILIPLAALSSGSRSYGGNVSCKGRSYADGTKWRSSCS